MQKKVKSLEEKVSETVRLKSYYCEKQREEYDINTVLKKQLAEAKRDNLRQRVEDIGSGLEHRDIELFIDLLFHRLGIDEGKHPHLSHSLERSIHMDEIDFDDYDAITNRLIEQGAGE